MSASVEDDDPPRLSKETLSALLEFYAEETERENLEVELTSQSNGSAIKENWQLSQFWYAAETIETLTKALLKSVDYNGSIALVSCPSLYPKVKQLCGGCKVTIFEYDKRFSKYGNDYIHYDYKFPLNIPKDLEKAYDVVIADPPFLAAECLTKTSMTIRFLAKDKIVVCTGEIMTDVVYQLLHLEKCCYRPHHQNNLANEFCCYSNFNFDEFIS